MSYKMGSKAVDDCMRKKKKELQSCFLELELCFFGMQKKK